MEAGGVEVAGGEVVEVVCAGGPYGLWLGGRGGEVEAGFVEGGEAWVACGGAEGLEGPVVGG